MKELTIEMISENFKVINKLYFNNELQTPRFEITSVKNYLGQYSCKYRQDGTLLDSVIRISDMFDRTESDICNTIAHECIHLYIRQNHIKDTRPHHGKVFNRIADRLNHEGGFHIARTDSVEGCGLRDKTKVKTYYIVCFKIRDKYFLFRVNKNYVEFHMKRFERNNYYDVFMFKSCDDKRFAHCRECRNGVWGNYISHAEFDQLKATEDVFYMTKKEIKKVA